MTRIRDPIHNYIHLDALGEELVAAPRFQRLRRIHQLGTGNLVYPGANHTRFEHSLGAHHLAGLAAQALDLDSAERLAVQAAALLHDVGHGPFSHLSDALYRDYLGKTHEEVAVDLLERGAFPAALERHDVEASSVQALIRGEGRLGRLVSGDIDVDRLDYLIRDSHATGVDIGLDLERLVSDFVLTDEGVALRHSSVMAAEMVLVTRLQMYGSVYYHRTLRVSERMIERAFRLALEAGEIKPEELPRMDDVAATMLLRHSKTDAWRLMLAVDQRKLYKVAFEESMDGLQEDLVLRASEDTTRITRLETEIAQALHMPAHDVILDVPPPPVLPEVDAHIQTADGVVQDLAKVSTLVRSLGPAQMDHWRLRVIVPASAREAAHAVAGKVVARALG